MLEQHLLAAIDIAIKFWCDREEELKNTMELKGDLLVPNENHGEWIYSLYEIVRLEELKHSIVNNTTFVDPLHVD